MQKNIEPKLRKIGEYLNLSPTTTFIIPEYQRAYSWAIDQCEKLWQDIIDFINDNGDDPYFFGTIIISCNDNDSKLVLIDGQQRTTTFILLLKALLIRLNRSITHTQRDEDSRKLHNTLIRKRDRVIKILYKVLDDQIDELLEDFSKGGGSSILENRSINELYKSELNEILRSETYEDAEKNVTKIRYKKKENKYTNYFKNFHFFNSKFADDKMSDSDINQFTEYILDKSEIIEIRSWNVEQAITMFNSLNSDGMPLQDADIISAKLYSNAGENRNIFDNKWQELKKIVDEIKADCNVDIDAILMQYMYIRRAIDKEYMSETGSANVTTPGLRRYYTDRKKELLTAPITLVDDLLKIANTWTTIKDYPIVRLSYAFNANIKLYLIAYLYRFDLDALNEEVVEQFLKYLLKIFAVLEVVDTVYSSSKFKPFLFALNVNLVDKDVKIEDVQRKIQDHIDKQWKKEEISKKIMEYDKNALVVFSEYLLSLQRQEKFDLKKNYDIEHIAPKSGHNIEAIREDVGFGNNEIEEFEEEVNKLGNKIILETKINRNLGNAWFRTKYKEYAKSEYVQAQEIAEKYGAKSLAFWTKDDIDARTEYITNAIVNFLFS